MEIWMFLLKASPYAVVFIFTVIMVFYYCQCGNVDRKSLPYLLAVHIALISATCGYMLASEGFKFAFAAAVLYVTIMFFGGMLGFIFFIIVDQVRYWKFKQKILKERGYTLPPLLFKRRGKPLRFGKKH